MIMSKCANDLVKSRRLLSLRAVFDSFEDLLNDFRVQRRAAMEWNHDPAATFRINPMTALRPQPNKCGFQE